jgi:hypothetical protein
MVQDTNALDTEVTGHKSAWTEILSRKGLDRSVLYTTDLVPFAPCPVQIVGGPLLMDREDI